MGERVSPPLVSAASEMSNVFCVIWSTSSSTSGPFELVEVLLPPALLFPDLLAEEDVLLNFAEVLVFSDFDPLSDLPHGSDSNFEPLLHEDLVEVMGLDAGMGDGVGDSVGDIDSVGNRVGISVGPMEQRTPVLLTYS